MAEQRTVWDRGWNGPGTETVWDRDWDGPGTQTYWDRLSAALGALVRGVVGWKERGMAALTERGWIKPR